MQRAVVFDLQVQQRAPQLERRQLWQRSSSLTHAAVLSAVSECMHNTTVLTAADILLHSNSSEAFTVHTLLSNPGVNEDTIIDAVDGIADRGCFTQELNHGSFRCAQPLVPLVPRPAPAGCRACPDTPHDLCTPWPHTLHRAGISCCPRDPTSRG